MSSLHNALNFYGSFLNLKEEPWVVDEAFVQRLWFEQVYKDELVTLTGEKIRLLQPGFWNHSAGPDFTRACLVDGAGHREVGAVEIHCEASAWKQHGHEADPHYDEVILHVVWKAGPKLFFAGDSKRRSVRTVELSSQLKVPLAEVRRHFYSKESERKVGARVGLCQRELAQLSVQETINLLEEAGWYRFQKKAELWSMRRQNLGWEQALWLGLADALGFSQNREAYKSLAQRLPIESLRQEKSALKREALLFGLAGFLPERSLPKEKKAHEWFRSLWDEWWQVRAEWEEQSLLKKSWVLRGVRPLNRPERRLAVLSLLSEPALWKKFSDCAQIADYKSMEYFMSGLSHPFWDKHSTLQSAASRTIQLMGKDRVMRFWFNVVGPLALAEGASDVRSKLEKMKTSEVMHPASVAALRLLDGRNMGSGGRSLLVKEGLLQVYQDFCLKDEEQCAGCAFPELVENWGKSK